MDSYAPNTFSIDDFGVSDILDNGNSPLASWQGYTPYGKLASKTSFYDFFKDTVNRPVDAFRPIYYAGFIEDKFVINDLILSLGLRIDAFDANMPVLKDKYTLTRSQLRRNFIKVQELLNLVLLEMTGQCMWISQQPISMDLTILNIR